jgi:hypothetical protein
MFRAGHILAAVVILTCAAPSAGKEPACEFCVSGGGETARPLRIEIESGIQFSRMALRGRADGDARIDPQTGEKVVGNNMIDLGGMSFHGRATVTGEPNRPVMIELPARVVLRSPDGAEATLSEFVTDLPSVAMLDRYGTLSFSFGARLSSQNARGGNFRGRIPIRVDYY